MKLKSISLFWMLKKTNFDLQNTPNNGWYYLQCDLVYRKAFEPAHLSTFEYLWTPVEIFIKCKLHFIKKWQWTICQCCDLF